jgi:hypothetical protein
LCFYSIKAQTYYGRNLFGRLQIINDSTGTITFISYLDTYSIDSCYIHKQGDTVFLSTKAQWRHKVNVYDRIQTATNTWFSTVIKVYEYSFPDKKYEYVGDFIGIYDSISKSIVVEEIAFYRGNYIIVYKDFFFYYRVKCSFGTDRNYLVLERNSNYSQGVVFNEFPLLIKGNRLIPIDKKKQAQCWLDNGFLFPKMKISKKNKDYHIINGHYIGLRNLPAEKEELKPFPRKYMKYLNSK